MSSKYIEKAWCFRTVSMEEKLLLVALAELSDRDGSFITSMNELKAMMCASDSMIDNLLGKLSIGKTIVGLNKRAVAYRADGKIMGRLSFDTYSYQKEVTPNQDNRQGDPSQDIFEQAKKISKFHRSQMAPIHKSISGKTINIFELSPNIVEEWAEVIMFKNGYGGQTNIWGSFIERLKEMPNKNLYSLDEMTRRLHSHLHNEKSYRQEAKNYTPKPQPIKRSAIEILEEKISNFNFKDDVGEDN